MAAKPVEQVTAHAVEEVVALECAGGEEEVDQGQGVRRPGCP